MITDDGGAVYQFGFGFPRPFARIRGDASNFVLGGPTPYPSAIGICVLQNFRPDHDFTLEEIEDLR